VRGFTGEGGSHRRAWLGAEERGCKSGELLGTFVRLAKPVETKSRVGRRRGGPPRMDVGTLGTGRVLSAANGSCGEENCRAWGGKGAKGNR